MSLGKKLKCNSAKRYFFSNISTTFPIIGYRKIPNQNNHLLAITDF